MITLAAEACFASIVNSCLCVCVCPVTRARDHARLCTLSRVRLACVHDSANSINLPVEPPRVIDVKLVEEYCHVFRRAVGEGVSAGQYAGQYFWSEAKSH